MMRSKDRRQALARCRVTDGAAFRLADHAPAESFGLTLDKDSAAAALRESTRRLSALQEVLYAQDRWAMLVLFQAMDAAGKDGAIKHVFSGVNPQGCEVTAYKAPTSIERDHDFLWRHAVALPRRGHLGIHNRSWYEEVLVARVHAAILAAQQLPDAVRGPALFDERLEDIAAFERYLARQGIAVLKVYLNVSPEEQRKRFLARIDEPEKHWKFDPNDVAERALRAEYDAAYEAAITATAAPHAPWYVIPADRKWLTRLLVSDAIVSTLEGLDLAFPEPDAARRAALDAARQALSA